MMRLWRLLASHNLALILIGLLSLAVLLGGTLPQVGRLPPEQLQEFLAEWGGVSTWLEVLGLSDLFASRWFFILYIALLINLAAGTALSIVRRYTWYQGRVKPTYQLHATSSAPLKHLLPLFPPFRISPTPGIQTRGVVGLWGLPLFHMGIAVIVLGSIWSSAAGFGAHLELSAGELYAGQQEKLAVDRGDSLPVELDAMLRLEQVNVEISEQKMLQELQAQFSYREGDGPIKQAIVEVNHSLKLGFYELSPNNTGGYSAVFERVQADGSRRQMLIHFNVPLTEWDWSGSWMVQRNTLVELGGIPLFYKMTLKGRENPSLALTVKRGVDVMFEGDLIAGSVADVGPYQLVFRGVVPWLGFYLASDYPKYVVFAGFIITLVGFLLHLLIYPRRIEVIKTEDTWTVKAWVNPGDWKFDEQWKLWSARIPSQ